MLLCTGREVRDGAVPRVAYLRVRLYGNTSEHWKCRTKNVLTRCRAQWRACSIQVTKIRGPLVPPGGRLVTIVVGTIDTVPSCADFRYLLCRSSQRTNNGTSPSNTIMILPRVRPFERRDLNESPGTFPLGKISTTDTPIYN